MKENNEDKEELPLFKTDGPESDHRESDNLEQFRQESVARKKVEPEVGFVKRAQVKNISVKRQMVKELERMGLSSKAIGRILNITVERK